MVWSSLILPSWSLSWFHILHPSVRKLHLSHQPVGSLTAANNKITKLLLCNISLFSGWMIINLVGQLTAFSLSLQEGVEDCRGTWISPSSERDQASRPPHHLILCHTLSPFFYLFLLPFYLLFSSSISVFLFLFSSFTFLLPTRIKPPDLHITWYFFTLFLLSF